MLRGGFWIKGISGIVAGLKTLFYNNYPICFVPVINI